MDGPRIISLIASSTEIVCALGFEENLVGRSHECDYPASVSALPIVTEPRFDVEGTSAEIDQRVKATLAASPADAVSVYKVHTDRLAELAPDVIITQSQCEVCAVSFQEVERAVCEVLPGNPKLVSLEPNALADIWLDIRKVAKALDSESLGEKLIAELKERLSELKARSGKMGRRPRVACVEWIEPLMAAGNWVPELVDRASGVNLFGEAGKHSPWMSWEDLRAAEPDVIVVMPCGFDIPKTRAEMPSLLSQPGFSDLKAVKNGRVALTDGNQYFNRPGPRIVESLEILLEIFYPGSFDFGHQGTGWEPL